MFQLWNLLLVLKEENKIKNPIVMLDNPGKTAKNFPLKYFGSNCMYYEEFH